MKFTKSHEWARREGDTVVIGISAHAQKELGDIVFVELPSVGHTITQFQQCGTVESTKTASELYSPVSGGVVEVNKELLNSPQWVNEDPYGKGWMIKVKITQEDEFNNLMAQDEYNEYLEQESH